ncbi:diacylglycerol/lipid kinase family protein [Bacteroidota bacterium]
MNTSKEKILFVINPKSGIKRHNNIIDFIKDNLDYNRFNPDFVFTERADHATELAKTGSADNVDIVVAVGGDGTVREVAKGLVNSKTKLAIITFGSGNGFAFHFNIPNNTSKAIEIINARKSLLIDTAKINGEYFGNIAGIGFDAKIAYEFSNYKKRGLYSYIRIIFREFFKYKKQTYKFEMDNKSFTKKAFLVSIANGSQFGNKAYINPEASVTDGLLEVCILSNAPIISMPFLIFKLLNKRLHKSKYLEVYKTSKAVISTNNLQIAHIDGDPFETREELKITINPSSLNIIVP